ncbi:MAG: chemotaxis response regulator protein-glutamate methylesterase, partial [Rhodobacterales bacterium]|nr:chemotaxis response regulator protein-glutamate methylesterase [Rhodobacterales bacterium]
TQNEETSEVYGMPKAAIEMGAAKRILSLEQIIKILSK